MATGGSVMDESRSSAAFKGRKVIQIKVIVT